MEGDGTETETELDIGVGGAGEGVTTLSSPSTADVDEEEGMLDEEAVGANFRPAADGNFFAPVPNRLVVVFSEGADKDDDTVVAGGSEAANGAICWRCSSSISTDLKKSAPP